MMLAFGALVLAAPGAALATTSPIGSTTADTDRPGPIVYTDADVPEPVSADEPGEAILGDEPTAPTLVEPGTGAQATGDTTAQSSCPGCLAYNSMRVRLYPGWERVGVSRTQSVADVNVPRIHAHVALLRNTQDTSCYGGDYRFTDGNTRFSSSSTAHLSSSNYSGFWDTWTQASGHEWTAPDGSRWAVRAANDRCWRR